jgi:hypothetical protein
MLSAFIKYKKEILSADHQVTEKSCTVRDLLKIFFSNSSVLKNQFFFTEYPKNKSLSVRNTSVS